MGLTPTNIKITELTIEESDDGNIEFIYTPNQTQTLLAGREYRFIYDPKQSQMRMENAGTGPSKN